mmetsp:Transcript_26401/g.42803  ORF Transcript_26401/g.42803 Transcript_26401/m.42803 type:complete len:577 (+) Transcript_26401:230-1960(+)
MAKLLFWLAVIILSGVPHVKCVRLWEYPMIYSHNAATGYLGNGGVVNRFGKNQEGNLYQQLQCGARALDIRPKIVGGEIYFYHGKAFIEVNFDTLLTNIIYWLALEGDQDDLVLVIIKLCSGDDCMGRVRRKLEQWGLPFFESCHDLESMTFRQAQGMGYRGRSGGPSLLIMSDCTSWNYDPSVRCYLTPSWMGRRRALQDSRGLFYDKCIDGDHKPFNKLKAHIKYHGSSRPASSSKLQVQNAYWNYDQGSILASLREGSSILEDNKRSNVNNFVLNLIPELGYINLLQVDNVCEKGVEITQALKRYMATEGLLPAAPTAAPTTAAPTSLVITEEPSSKPTTPMPSHTPTRPPSTSPTSHPSSAPTVFVPRRKCEALNTNRKCVLPFTYVKDGVAKMFFECPTFTQASPDPKFDGAYGKWCFPRPKNYRPYRTYTYDPSKESHRRKWVTCGKCLEDEGYFERSDKNVTAYTPCPGMGALRFCSQWKNKAQCNSAPVGCASCVGQDGVRRCKPQLPQMGKKRTCASTLSLDHCIRWKLEKADKLPCPKRKRRCSRFRSKSRCASRRGCYWCRGRCS